MDMLDRQDPASKEQIFLLPCPYRLPAEGEARGKVWLPTEGEAGGKVCLPTPKVQTRSGFTHFKPSRVSLTDMPSISRVKFIADEVKLTTKIDIMPGGGATRL